MLLQSFFFICMEEGFTYRIYRVWYILMSQDSVQRCRVWHCYKGGNDSLPGWTVSQYNDINHFRTIPRYSHSHRTVPAQQISFLAKQYQIFKLGRGWWSEWSEIFFHRFKFSKMTWHWRLFVFQWCFYFSHLRPWGCLAYNNNPEPGKTHWVRHRVSIKLMTV